MAEERNVNKERLKKGIYILPNACTSLNLFSGFISIISAIEGQFVLAAIYIIVATVFDALDGKIARATNTTSNFGVEYDSLCDLVSFGLAPSLLFYLWALNPMDRAGWLAAFLFTACGALRLARFNTSASAEVSPDSKFTGLPIPGAASMVATTVLFCIKFGLTPEAAPMIFLLELYALSFLMVSSVKYESFKKVKLFSGHKFNALVAVILVFVVVAQNPHLVLFLIMLTYVVSGPLVGVFMTFILKKNKIKA